MKLVEHWRWRYRDAKTGRVCRTSFHLTADEAEQRFPGAQRIEGSMTQRDVDSPDFADTAPLPYYARRAQ
jgi:hypothetical protein